MPEIFVISDTHFGHENILKFTHEGAPMRPFKSLTEMHVEMIDRWNSMVSPRDKVYHLGDVAWTHQSLKILSLCNGRKRLVRGNHDTLPLSAYREVFQEVYGVRQIDGVWLTHVPMHEECVEAPKVKMNIHGHIHARKLAHPKYFNASVECIDYTPAPWDEIV